MKRVSIVLLNYNNERDTFRCLSSLVKIDYPAFEVVVVDTGSNEKSANKLNGHVNKLKRSLKVRIIQLSPNRGFTGGCNAGVRGSKSDYVVLLSNDTTVTKGYLREILKAKARLRRCNNPEPERQRKRLWRANNRDTVKTYGVIQHYRRRQRELTLEYLKKGDFRPCKDRIFHSVPTFALSGLLSKIACESTG